MFQERCWIPNAGENRLKRDFTIPFRALPGCVMTDFRELPETQGAILRECLIQTLPLRIADPVEIGFAVRNDNAFVLN